jgi:hypothetical protein
MEIVADGIDVLPASPHPEEYHTLYASMSMTSNAFLESFAKLPWRYAGKKR